ncbi:hypothetical protein ERJ75_000949400 [Trypanosoma vivax]|uniref:Putative syntaxin n=1 Tax=Trypanosoma vivax (strain Y486) TaxID=1055687 RepID=G0U4K4_TRYVY|nr:hypothetical protein ERJ75_000949400 [Trypanosoma vivax]CCC52368.1 putative syntaxin [Trypanosoma vivax Y486]
MRSFMPNSDALIRSTLRETIKRIRRVRTKAGRSDEADVVESTGDPYHDLSLAFIRCVERTKAGIDERNQGLAKHGEDRVFVEQSNAIRKDIRNLEALVDEVKQYVDQSDAALRHENKKKRPNSKKLALLEERHRTQMSQYKECLSTLELVKQMELERGQTKGKEAVDFANELSFGRKAQLREQLTMLRLPGKDGGGHVDPCSGVEMTDRAEGGGRLEDHRDTAGSMKTIAEQDAKINVSLDVIKMGVSRLRDLAIGIGGQLDMQNKSLARTEEVMTKQADQLSNLNRRLKKIMGQTTPMSMFLYACCILLILSVMSFALMQFNII